VRAATGLLLSALVLYSWSSFGQPEVLLRLRTNRQAFSAPLELSRVQTRLKLLPKSALDPKLEQKITRLIVEDQELEAKEKNWEMEIQRLLNAEQREQAIALVDWASPPAPSPPEFPTIDGELVALVEAGLNRYGYDPNASAESVTAIPWALGRQMQVRAVRALVMGPGVEPEIGRTITNATLTLLEVQRKRQQLNQSVKLLFGLAMGEWSPLEAARLLKELEKN
jgi:hypothetical protein